MKSIFFFLLLIPLYLDASDYQITDKPVWIDVRTSKEYKAGHKKGAILIMIPWFIGIFFIMEFFPLSN